MKQSLRRFGKICVSLLLCGMLLFTCAAPAIAEDVNGGGFDRPVNAHLTFNEDGEFTILQVADIQDGALLTTLAKETLRAAVEKTNPDLIMLTGDNIAGYVCTVGSLPMYAIRQFMEIFEEFGIPVAAVYGNHDDQNTAMDKEAQMEVYMEYDCFIGCKGVVAEKTVGSNTMKNVGTYNIPVFASKDSDQVLFNVWCFDSGNYNPDNSVGGYGYVLPEQVAWYEDVSNALKAENGGEPVPSIAFQHIVPPQIYRALKEVPKGTEGAITRNGKYYTLPDDVDPATNWLGEPPCPPNVDFEPAYAQVDSMVRQGDVVALFYGHDHINSYIVPYEGIDLVSSPGMTYLSYNDANRGFRTITINKADPSAYTTRTYTVEELFEGNTFRTVLLKLQSIIDIVKGFFVDLWNTKLQPLFS
ncbi:MAG: metallophosphoesterase [Clostridia bacterium]|nr:metallophosphoesterase [Clostridia bacterium]